jgi:hypothetical protein
MSVRAPYRPAGVGRAPRPGWAPVSFRSSPVDAALIHLGARARPTFWRAKGDEPTDQLVQALTSTRCSRRGAHAIELPVASPDAPRSSSAVTRQRTAVGAKAHTPVDGLSRQRVNRRASTDPRCDRAGPTTTQVLARRSARSTRPGCAQRRHGGHRERRGSCAPPVRLPRRSRFCRCRFLERERRFLELARGARISPSQEQHRDDPVLAACADARCRITRRSIASRARPADEPRSTESPHHGLVPDEPFLREIDARAPTRTPRRDRGPRGASWRSGRAPSFRIGSGATSRRH